MFKFEKKARKCNAILTARSTLHGHIHGAGISETKCTWLPPKKSQCFLGASRCDILRYYCFDFFILNDVRLRCSRWLWYDTVMCSAIWRVAPGPQNLFPSPLPLWPRPPISRWTRRWPAVPSKARSLQSLRGRPLYPNRSACCPSRWHDSQPQKQTNYLLLRLPPYVSLLPLVFIIFCRTFATFFQGAHSGLL